MIKSCLSWMCFLVVGVAAGQNATPGARETTTISSGWQFQMDVPDIGSGEGWYASGFDRSAWAKAIVPKAWDLLDEALWGYEGVGWYATKIEGAAARKDKVQRLKFGRVNYHTKVWLNGEPLGENVNGYLPFEFDVTGKLRPEAANLLVLRVDNRPRLAWLPGAKQIEWIQYGGILEPVTLESSTKIYISDLTINAVPEREGASIACKVKVTSQADAGSNVTLRLVVEGSPQSAKSALLKIPPGATVSQTISLSLPKANPWSPENPFLYRLAATVENGTPMDAVTSHFGVRKIETRGREILLNGRRFRAKGVNRYDEYGKYGPKAPRELLVADLRRMKNAGVNMVRVHYPQSPEILSLYDEMGFVMIEEVPINWWANGFSGKGDEVQSEGILDQAMPALERMIQRDKNHPSVIIWSMCNESQTANEIGTSVMRKLIRRAKELDSSRLVTYVIPPRESKPERAFEEADLVAVNVYHGSLSGKIANHASQLEELVTKPSEEYIRRQLATWPDKPLLITEFGTRGVPGIHGDMNYSEDFQAACIQATWKAIRNCPEASGGVLWSWADYYHRRALIQYAVFGPYGVVTVDRRPKAALGALAKMYGGAAADTSAMPTSALGLEPGRLRLSNEDVGVIVWGPDSSPTLSVGKSDVWDRRNPKPPQPVLTLARIIEMARAEGFRDLGSYYTVYGSYDFPCPKPVGQLILRLPFMESGGTLKVNRDRKFELGIQAANGSKTLDLRIFVSALRNLIVLEGRAEGLAAGDIAVRLYRHRDTIVPGGELNPTIGGKNSPLDFEQLAMPRAGGTKEGFWIAQDFLPDPTFPAGFTSVLAARVLGAQATVTVINGESGLGTPLIAEREGRIDHGTYKRFAPINQAAGSAATATLGAVNGNFQIIATVITTQDAPNPLVRTARDLAEAARLGAAALHKEHEERLSAYGQRPRARAWSADGKVNIDEVWGGVPYRVRPDGYYGDVSLCSVDSTKFCFQDSSIWHADFHFNEIDATRAMILRQFDSLDSYFRMIRTMLPMAQANAREVYGCRGAMYPLVHYPLKSDSVIRTHATWEQSMEITALLARPFWLRYLYSGDLRFLREFAWPVLREGARFYSDFLKLESDSRYHVFPTVSPEHRGITKNLQLNRDSQSSITLIRYHLRAAARAAELLSLEPLEASLWRKIAAGMPDYPVIDTPAGKIFTDVEGGQPIEYNIAVPLSAVFWGDDIGLDSPPAQLELARRTLREINVWLPHRFYLARVRARLGLPAPDDNLDAEHFLQSYTGVLRAFPAVPADFEGGFENLGAQGAFVVSAKRAGGMVESVDVMSLAGNPCTIANPWPGREALVDDSTSGKRITARQGDGCIRFQTEREHTYRVRGKYAESR